MSISDLPQKKSFLGDIQESRSPHLHSVKVHRIAINENCVYTFKEPIELTFDPDNSGCLCCWKRSQKHITTYGTNEFEARRKWELKFHETFQKLFGKDQWNMTAEEQAIWSDILKVLDFDAYRRTCPVTLFQTGKLQSDGTIAWLNGEVEFVPPLNLACSEFARLEEGDAFEALVERDFVSNKIRKILHIVPVVYDEKIDEEELHTFVNSLSTSSDLPEADLDAPV